MNALDYFFKRDRICSENICNETCPLYRYSCGAPGALHSSDFDLASMIEAVENCELNIEAPCKHDEDKLIDALHSIVWYEGLARDLIKLKSSKPGPAGCIFPCIPYKDFYPELSIFWSLLVLLYGNYGTSPRVGWIETDKFSDACKFIDRIVNSANDDE